MQYEGQICRPPMERASYMLPVAVGCSYNACKFCMLFKHLSYRELPREQIEAEMQRVHGAGGNPKTIFLGDWKRSSCCGFWNGSTTISPAVKR